MSGAGVPEKILRQSQSVRCLENVRRDDEVLERVNPLQQWMHRDARCGQGNELVIDLH
jgi:hypothetical protein